MGRKARDVTGMRFGRLVAIEPFDTVNGTRRWRCKCDCGNETITYISNLGKSSNSCGCLAREKSRERNGTHLKSKSRIFPIWQSMKQRCQNERCKAYPNYGGRGISVCNDWDNDFEAFEKWALENGYDENAKRGECSIDRIDVNGNYEPSNCRIISMNQQAGNKRNCVFLEHDGRRMTIAEWSRETGISDPTIRGRLNRGWSVEMALTKEPQRHRETTND